MIFFWGSVSMVFVFFMQYVIIFLGGQSFGSGTHLFIHTVSPLFDLVLFFMGLGIFPCLLAEILSMGLSHSAISFSFSWPFWKRAKNRFFLIVNFIFKYRIWCNSPNVVFIKPSWRPLLTNLFALPLFLVHGFCIYPLFIQSMEPTGYRYNLLKSWFLILYLDGRIYIWGGHSRK